MVAERLKRHSVSFRYAFKGVLYAFKTQPNFLVHLFFALTALVLGLAFRITWVEWLILVVAIFLVLGAEMVNTAIETVTDALKAHKKTDQDDFYIMVAKDVAAGGVLLCALAATVVGLIIFLPRLIVLFS